MGRIRNELALAVLAMSLLTLATRASVAEDPAATAPAPTAQRSLIVVVGASGEDAFGEQFRSAAQGWEELATKQQWPVTLIGNEVDKEKSDRERLEAAIAEGVKLNEQDELWIVLIGHGTFGSNIAKFNLVGPDVAATDLNSWLKPIKAKAVVINCSSSSGPFLTTLSGPNRTVVTATNSGSEQNYSRFGKFMAESLSDLSADIDHDYEISLLEAFLAASSRTERFYTEDARLATEHALLDDNGDRVGTTSDFYRGVRPAKVAAAGKKVDGRLATQQILFSAPDAIRLSAAQQAERSQIEAELESLRTHRSDFDEPTYLDKVEPLMLKLAKLYAAAE